MTGFEYTIAILGSEIQKERINGNQYRIPELRKVIKILTDGKGYLTRGTPKNVQFYGDMK
jgi:hypothetical protein